MSIKRLFGAIAFRTLLIGSVVTGLSFLYPPALAIFIGTGVLTLGISVAVTVNKCKKSNYIDDIPIGDLEYYEFPKESLYSKVETKVLDTVEEIPYKIEKVFNKNKNKDKNKNSENNETLTR